MSGVLWPLPYLDAAANAADSKKRKVRTRDILLTGAGLWTYFVHMKTVTVRQLRNSFSMLEAWLAEGEEIHIEKRGQLIGVLTGCKVNVPPSPVKPDFAARRKAIWGERLFTEAEVAAMRADELEGEEG